MATGALRRPAAPRAGLGRLRLSGQSLLLGTCALVVGYLVLSPLVFLLISSFRRYELNGSIGFTFTFANYLDTYLSPDFLPAAGNSIIYAGGGTLIAVLAGTGLAWVVARTNTPLRGLYTLLAATTYFVPGVLMAVAWSALANPRNGSLNKLLQNVIPVDQGPLDVNSMLGMIWVFGTHLYPIVFLIMAAAFRSMDPALEEAAALSGAGIGAILRTITLAVSRPAVISAVLIIFVRGLESFDVPLMLGLPAKIDVLTTQIYANAALHHPPELGISSSLGVLLLLVSVAGVYYYRSATAAALSFSTISGKGYRPQRLDLGRGRMVAAFACGVFFFVTLALPLLATVWISLFPFVRQPSLEALARASFGQYQYVFGYDAIIEAFRNSLLNAALVATFVVVLTSLVAWITLRSKIRGSWILDALAFAPIGVPGTIMGVSILLVYLTLPIPLYGTIFLVTIAHITLFLPYGMRLASDALLRIHPQLEEASELSGATFGRTYREIILPLILPGLLAAWVTILAASFRELSAAIFLGTPGSRMVSVVMYSAWADGNSTAAAALGVVILLVVVTLALSAWVLGRVFRFAA